MLEFVAELLFEVVFQFLGEVFGEAVGRLLSTRAGRLVFSAVVGFAGGFAWGSYVESTGAPAPKTLWVSLVFAVGGVYLAVLRRESVPAHEEPPRGAILPWRWSPGQWESFALLNVFVALGVALGYYGV